MVGRTRHFADASQIRRSKPHVDHLGRVDDITLAALYANCSFLVFPSLYEGVGLPLLEAMAHGKPLITSNTSSMPEVAGAAGILVDPVSVREIETAMAQLIDDRDLYRSLADAASKQSRCYSWEQTATRTLQILEAAGRRST